MQRITTLTINPAVDTGSAVEHVVPEWKLRCQRPHHEPGGGGINVSRAVRNLGGESVALYTAGGRQGEMLRGLLDQAGLDHRPIPIEALTRENLTFLEESTGLQFRFGMPGPLMQDAEWRRCLQCLSDSDPKPDYIVGSGSLPPGVPDDFYARVVQVGKRIGARVIIDTSGEALGHALREGVYLVKPNLRELSLLVGSEILDETGLEQAARDIVAGGQSEVVVVSLGAPGALLVWKDGLERLRTPSVPVKSKIGAGDSMVAAITLSLARGWSIRDAVRFGIAAGAAAVMTPGTELCRREDTERLYEKIVSES